VGRLPIEILSECLIDNLRDGQAVQVRLTPDRLDPAALDMEGDALGLLRGAASMPPRTLSAIAPLSPTSSTSSPMAAP